MGGSVVHLSRYSIWMSDTILLCPRPLARYGGRFLLLPLLPHKPPLKPLPAEVWSEIFTLALSSDASRRRPTPHGLSWYVSLMLVCKSFQRVAAPILYSNVKFRNLDCLDKFTTRLRKADQMWDSIRRIPYSTPGRWVQILDLSEIPATLDSKQALAFDSLLTTLFPLVPFLETLTLSSTLPLSRRALTSLTNRDGVSNLRILRGVCYDSSFNSTFSIEEDPFVRLLQSCHHLECLEVVGSGLEPVDWDSDAPEAVQVPASNVVFNLSRMHTITLLSMPSSSLMHALLNTSLPHLRALSLTPYEDIPYPRSLTSRFIDVHGFSLSTLSFFTPKAWPTHLHPSPGNIFHTCPNLRQLFLESPLPALLLPDISDTGQTILPLQVLSIPRPNHDFWGILETLLPSLPLLKVVRVRDVRWLRRGLTRYAQETGVQGEMRAWRQRLARRSIHLLDGDWKDMT